MTNVLINIGVLYLIYLAWRITGSAFLMWRQYYAPAENKVEEVAFEDLPEEAKGYFLEQAETLVDLGFNIDGYLHLTYYQETAGIPAYSIMAWHRTKPHQASATWIQVRPGYTNTSRAFETWLIHDEEILTEHSLVSALMNDTPGQDKLVFIQNISTADLLATHCYRVASSEKTTESIDNKSLGPVATMQMMYKRCERLMDMPGPYYRDPNRPGYRSTFLNIVKTKFKTSFLIRDIFLHRQRWRANRWLKRALNSD